MKKFITCAVFLALATASFCQKRSLSSEEYLTKSKNQKKVAWILLGGGAIIATVGAVIPAGDLTGEISYPCLCQDVRENDEIKAALGLSGGVSMLASIPFFIASGKNKKRAKEATAFLNMEKATVIRGASIGSRSFPALGIRITL